MQSNLAVKRHDSTSDYSNESQYADKAPGLLTGLRIAASQLVTAGHWAIGGRKANEEANCAALCGLETLIAALRDYTASKDSRAYESWSSQGGSECGEPKTVWNNPVFQLEAAECCTAVRKMDLPDITRHTLAGALACLSHGTADCVVSAIAHAAVAHRIISGRVH